MNTQEIQDFEKTFGNDEIVSVGHSGSRVFEVTEEKLKSFISQKLKEQRQELLEGITNLESNDTAWGGGVVQRLRDLDEIEELFNKYK